MEKQLYTVLSIDGGGIRGIIPLRIIAEIERRLGRPISDAIDMAAGTSTGGIIAAGLSMRDPKRPDQPRFKATDLEKFYDDDGPDIFRKRPFNRLLSLFRPKYDNTVLKDSLNRFFGETRLDQTLNSIMLTAYDIERRESVFMRHLKNNPDGDNERRWRIRDATLASSSAPTYFEPARIRSTSATPGGTPDDPRVREHTLVDGGIYVNNPSAVAFIAAHKEKPPESEVFVLSLGTGSVTRVFQYEEARRWGGLGWINPQNDVPIVSTSMDGQSSSADQNMEFLLGDQYIRLDAPLKDPDNPGQSPNDAFDDASPENMAKIRLLADRMIVENSDKLDQVVDILRARMLQKDLERGDRPEPSSSELIEAARPRDDDSVFHQLASWWRRTREPANTAAKDLGWDSEKLDKARKDRPGKSEDDTHALADDLDHTSNQTNVQAALEALARRYGKLAGKSGREIEADIDDALAAAAEMTENGELVQADEPEAEQGQSFIERVRIMFGSRGNKTAATTARLERLINGDEPVANDAVPVEEWGIRTKDRDTRPDVLFETADAGETIDAGTEAQRQTKPEQPDYITVPKVRRKKRPAGSAGDAPPGSAPNASPAKPPGP